MTSQTWWYVARASGIVAWVLVSASVVFGLWVSVRLTRKRPRPAWTLDIHRFLGGLSVVFVGVHLAALAADSYIGFGPSELFVPLASAWKPVAVAWGIIGVYLLLAIEITSLLMRRLPRRIWHAVHLTSFGLFIVATVHMFTAGTDSGSPLLQWGALGVTGLVVFLTASRVLGARNARRPSARVSAAPVVAEPAVADPVVMAPEPEPVAAISWAPDGPPRSAVTTRQH